MNWYTDTASWALILGVLTPLVVSVVQQPKWPSQLRAVVALVAAVVVGTVTVLANGGFDDTSGVLGIIALVLVASNTAYATLWKPTGIAPLIEAKTSRGAYVVTAVEESKTAVPGTPSTAKRRRDDRGEGALGLVIGALVVIILVVVVLSLLHGHH